MLCLSEIVATEGPSIPWFELGMKNIWENNIQIFITSRFQIQVYILSKYHRKVKEHYKSPMKIQ